MNDTNSKTSNEAAEAEAKRPFSEPEISDPVDVVKGNPAAGALFAVVSSIPPAP